MPRWVSVLPLCAVVAALVAGCGSAIGTGDLIQVQLSSYQALPPPYGSAEAVLTSAASLATFEKAVAADGIGLNSSSTTSAGCAGGIEYTIVLLRSGGKPSTKLDAYDCGGTVTGNITGNVSGFLDYVSTLLVATPSGQP